MDISRPSRMELGQWLKQKLQCGRSLVRPWKKTFGLPQNDSGKVSGDLGGESSALLTWCIAQVGCC